ncbi:hypothetical protein H310_01928, partial [Aphanomyces invadans]
MTRQDEVDVFQKLVPAAGIESCCLEQLQATIQYTRYRRLRFRLRFPDTYPNDALVIELTSDTLPDFALRRMTKFVDAKATELAKAGQPQVQAVVELILSSLADNKLLYAFDEVRQLRLLAEQNGGDIKLNERTGRIKLLLRHKAYFFHANIKLDDHYPDSPIAISCDESNLPPSIVALVTKQVNDMVARIVQGYTAEQALFASNPIKKPVSLVEAIADEATPAKKSGPRKAAAKVAIKASPRDSIAPMYYAQDGGILHHAPLDVAVKSLIPVVKTFLWTQCLVGLADTACVSCNEPILGSDPLTKVSDTMQPIQAYCGHWYHHACLGAILQSPPFVHGCKACNVVLHHPKWSTNVDDLKRAHERAIRQARELEEIADMF